MRGCRKGKAKSTGGGAEDVPKSWREGKVGEVLAINAVRTRVVGAEEVRDEEVGTEELVLRDVV